MPVAWTDTLLCRSRNHCVDCRDREGGREFRESISKSYDTGGLIDFPCPFGGEWGKVPVDAPTPPAKPPSLTAQLVNFAKATSAWVQDGKPVVPEKEFRHRHDICLACPNAKLKNDGTFKRCLICGCHGMKLAWATEKCPDDPPRWGVFTP